MLVKELIELLQKAPKTAEVSIAYDSMCCVNSLKSEDVWMGPNEYYDEKDNIISNITVFLCAVSADMDYAVRQKRYKAKPLKDL